MRLSATLAVAFCAIAATGHCDERDAARASTTASPRAVDTLPLGTTTAYPDRWCIETFIAESRRIRPAGAARSRTLVPYAFSPSSADELLAGADPEFVDSSSLYNRLKALSKLRLMTLWRGRDSALVVALNESGILGLTLDEAAE